MHEGRKANTSDDGGGLGSLRSSRKGYIIILALFGCLVVIASILTLLYRETPKHSEILSKKKRASAKHSSIAVIFGRVDKAVQDRIVQDIIQDVGVDSTDTDFIVGSTVSDPWCASLTEYQFMLRKAMTESKELPIGKQTLIMSMVTGLLAKTDLPARVYLIGNLNTAEMTERSTAAVMKRSDESAVTMAWRNEARAPVQVISYMDTTTAINKQYLDLFRRQPFAFTAR